MRICESFIFNFLVGGIGIFRKGRPTVEGSKRQEVLAARAAKAASGIEVKRGRPKMIKQDDLVILERA